MKAEYARRFLSTQKKKKSVAGQFAVKSRSERYSRTQKLNREDYGVDKYCVLLAIVQE
jgi:hypothetical protein